MPIALKRFFAWLANCIYPRGLVCICCGKELRDAERFDEICRDCEERLPVRIKNVCPVCGENLMKDCCPVCDSYGHNVFKAYYDKIVAPMYYSGAPRKWILDYKDAGKSWLSANISKFIAEALAGADGEIITYVPTIKKAVRRRGFDNSRYLAKAVAKRLSLPIIGTLERVSQSKDSPDLTSEQRSENIKNNFKVAENVNSEALKDKNVILVDDVLTTGVTASECARLLKTLGAKKVTVAVLCRTQLKYRK